MILILELKVSATTDDMMTSLNLGEARKSGLGLRTVLSSHNVACCILNLDMPLSDARRFLQCLIVELLELSWRSWPISFVSLKVETASSGSRSILPIIAVLVSTGFG